MLDTSNSESSAHPAKRKRQEFSSDVPNIGDARRSTDFWFKDGSIILLAENTLFRVHSGVMIINSKFFEDLLEVPQPADETLFEGCPLVHMHDTAEDWKNLLTFVYYSTTLQQIKKELSFEFLSSMLRLGKKYQFDHIRDNALDRLKSGMPQANPASIRNWISKWRLFRVVDVINLAVELDIQSILPIFYYVCATYYSPEQIVRGIPGTDPNVLHRLAPETQQIVVIGQSKLQGAVKDHALGWLLKTPPNQSQSPHCITMGCRTALWLSTQQYAGRTGKYNCEWVDELSSTTVRKLCNVCGYVAQEKITHGRTAFWKAVPPCFALADWENLSDFTA